MGPLSVEQWVHCYVSLHCVQRPIGHWRTANRIPVEWRVLRAQLSSFFPRALGRFIHFGLRFQSTLVLVWQDCFLKRCFYIAKIDSLFSGCFRGVNHSTLWRIGSTPFRGLAKRSILRTGILWEIDWVRKLHIYNSGKKPTCTQSPIYGAIMVYGSGSGIQSVDALGIRDRIPTGGVVVGVGCSLYGRSNFFPVPKRSELGKKIII